jgi:4'-phosphopantetheinyl transferase
MDGEIHVWTARFADDDSMTNGALALLDATERVRAARLVRRRDRMRFIQFRAFARRVLGGYLGVPAEAVGFTPGPNGKPQIDRRASQPELHFNISHSGDCCLLAARRRCPVGIDIEAVRDLPDALAIARRFFTRSEADLLARLDGDARRHAFFALWTHKEAAVKALGESLAANLERLEFTLDPAGHPRLNSLAAAPAAAGGFWLRRIDAPPGHMAALASLGPRARIVPHAWNEPARDAVPAREHAPADWLVPQAASAALVRSRPAFDHPRGA